ncbi:tetratricopeptide repeat protein [Mesorhizobium sp.]|uniref:tetratricopeptide repeat protein n=1 Tax=Mesorhizobium sp. TaxID=1871066 RepID=UPI000FEA239D|nr:tetratricopeptide repeat protein [Mesorhizobium sp.]RWD63339.1 MAG: tetratricopeptide repeat protein [Mesorhizobium sp.]TIV53832.1 MAG: tetratricopeptide repeat protein [Mesorhizobium sp.]
MSRRIGAVSRIFVAVLSYGLALVGVTVLGALATPAFAGDYALCFGDESGGQSSDQKEANVDQAAVDQRIAACTAIAEDVTQAQRQRIKAYFYRGSARDDREDWDGAIADYSQAIALDPKATSALFNRGTDWSNKGDYDRAIADFNIVISLEPSASDAYSGRGSAFLRKGKIDAAMLDFQQAIEADPQNGDAHTGLGTVWSKTGERDKAIAEYDKAIRIDPGDFIALVNRGLAYAAKDEFDRAIADYDAALAVDPGSADAYANRSAAWIGKNDWARAIADANKAIELDAGMVDGYYARAVAWASKDNDDRALADFDKVIALDATDARAWLGRSLMRSRKGDSAGAAADCRKAIALDPKKIGSCDAGPANAEMPAAETASKPDLSSLAKQLETTGRQVLSKEAAAQIREALKQQASGDVPGAIASFGYAISLDPDNAEAYYDRAVAAASQGDNALAASDCRRAVELDPQRAGACAALMAGGQTVPAAGTQDQAAQDQAAARILVERAGARLAKYGVDGALLDFDKAIGLDPKNADAYLGRSRARTLKGNQAGAAADCRRAVELDPARSGSCDQQTAGDEGKAEQAQDSGQSKPAAAAADAQTIHPNLAATDDTLAAKSLETKDQRALQAILGGDAWLDMGKYDKAIGAYDVVIALEPDNRFGYFGRGRARAATRDYGQAIADFDRVIQLAPNFAAAYFRRGLAKVTSGDVDGALADCDRAATLDPKARDAHYCKGMAWHAKGDAGRAVAAYTVAIGIDAKDDAIYYARGMARADSKDYAGAIADFDEALKLDPGNSDYAVARKAAGAAKGENQAAMAETAPDPVALAAALERGDASYRKRKYDRAATEYSRAVALAPNEPSTYSARARARLQKGDLDGALADVNRALEIDPSYITAYHTRALILIKKREPEKAIADYNRAIEMKPDNASLYFGRGSTWYSIGDFDRAAADLDRALRLDPKSEMARQGRKLATAAKKKALASKTSGKLASQAGQQAPAPQALTRAYINAEVQKQDSQILKAIAEEFPDDYNALLDNVMVVARLGGKQAVENASRVAVAKLRRRYAPLLPSTPDNEASQALSAQLAMINYLMARQTPATCDNYLRLGPDAVSASDNEFLVHLDRIGATLFRAFGAAKRSGLPAAEPEDQDWSLVAEAFTKSGGTPTEMEAIANANQASAGLCPATAKLFAAALSLQGEPGRHVKTALLYAIVKN